MKAVHYDAKTGEELPAFAVKASVAGFCSWHRFPEVLRAGGQLRDNEELSSIQIDARGITFRVVSL